MASLTSTPTHPVQVCLFSQVCANAERMFQLQKEEEWECEFDRAAFDELQGWLCSSVHLQKNRSLQISVAN